MASSLVQASSGNIIPTLVSTTTPRRSANYHPSIWGDHFLAYTTPDHIVKTSAEVKEHEQLLREVKKMVVTAADEPQKQLNLIDVVQRLGVAYHFEAEIGAALQSMNINTIHHHDDDFHNVALCFRLLRQQGYNVSSDVFHKIKDCSGNFKENLKRDTRGVLSLYEAAHVRVHGEDILDEALAFTTSQLEHLKSDLTNPLATQVIGALKCPIRKGFIRLEARRYISIYQEDESHNKLLLNFAKLDFNLLQKEHQRELGHITRWWKGLNCAEKFPFARDRLVECYFWILGVFFEPQYLMARRFLTKIIALATIADDIYDVYGTLEELAILTDAIERWDTSSLDQIPKCMGVFYRALLDVYNEMEKHVIETGKPWYHNCISYAKDSFKELLRTYLAEAKWLHEGHVPTLEEYMSVALLSGGYKMMATHSFVGMGDVVMTMDVFDWVSTFPLMVKASSIICRLSDDIVGYEVEQERGEAATAVTCYMKQHGVTKQEAYAEFKEQITNAWKDMNKECLHPTAAPIPVLTTIYNLTRVINLLYDGEDCYTNSNTRTKEFITSVLIDPIVI